MPKRQRLSRADFASISAAKHRRFFGTYFSLSVAVLPVSDALHEPKFACVVSKKIATHAVDRNLVKRQCREAVRLAPKSIAMPVSLVFYAKKEAKGVSYKEIEDDGRKLLSQVK
jgi:ribonuclease P protein component